jgi:hypothetical protein
MLMVDIIPQTEGASMTNRDRPAVMAKGAFTRIAYASGMKIVQRSLSGLFALALAACSGGPQFSTRGLVVPTAQCDIDPYAVGEAEQLAEVDEGNGCMIPNPWRMRSLSGVSLSRPATLNCGAVEAVNDWLNGTVQTAAERHFGEKVVAVDVAASYACRARNNVRGALMSEHGFGNAIDISAFTLADGRKVAVKQGWWGPGDERAFLEDVRSGACGEFTTVLGPGSDRQHGDHLHLDLAQRRSGTYCR